MCQRNRPLRKFFSYVSTLKVIDYDFQSRPAPGSASTSSQPAVYFIEKPENPDVGQVDFGDHGGCGSCQGWRGTALGEFRWFPVESGRGNVISRTCTLLIFQKLQHGNFRLSETQGVIRFPIFGAEGANPPRRLVLVILFKM